MSVLISMLVGSELSTKSLVEKSILSILSNIGTSNFLLVIGISSYIKIDIIKSIEDIKSSNNNIIIVTDHCATHAGFHNYAFCEYGKNFKWIISAHDDIELKTGNLINNIEDSLKSSIDIGWISFTDDGYLKGFHTPSVRPGFHSDLLDENAWARRKLFQFHLLEENYWKKGKGLSYFTNLNYDFPILTVKCHAPYSHFIVIKSENLRGIGQWEEWGGRTAIPHLTDEDMGLTALKNGLMNVWIPNIIYTHVRNEDRTRASGCVEKELKFVHRMFAEKWGYPYKCSRSDFPKIRKMYGNTNIVWSMDRKSFDWNYLNV